MTSRQAAVYLTVLSVLTVAAVVTVLTDAPRPIQVAAVVANSVAGAAAFIRAERPPRPRPGPRRRR